MLKIKIIISEMQKEQIIVLKEVDGDRHFPIVIGDTESDVMAAASLGYPSIAVCSGMREREILELQEPTYLVDDLGGVDGALRSAGAL